MSQSKNNYKEFGQVTTNSIIKKTYSINGQGLSIIHLPLASVILVNSSINASKLVLPSDVAPGSETTIIQNNGSNNCTINESDGNLILGSTANILMTSTGQSITLIYTGNSSGWAITANNGAILY